MKELLGRLPEISALRDRCRAMAMLDAIVSPDWESRYYSFNSAWGEGEEMASMRDGQGNDWFIVFTAAGVYGRGFDHEAPNAQQVLRAVPSVFESQVAEPAFADHEGAPLATVCFWREPGDDEWGVSTADLGGQGLFELLLEGTPQAYRLWAADYYEVDLDLAAVEHVYELQPLTPAVIDRINPAVRLSDLHDDLEEIGYPR
ncbi:hypothetical protein [Nocardia terrae]|uniref:hypothetical protein n=1 Tax=Nocardia terrae TaxID=2675851 RepID=UPI0018DEF6F4|nr:hypothetical protein [Nocardia terrae]